MGFCVRQDCFQTGKVPLLCIFPWHTCLMALEELVTREEVPTLCVARRLRVGWRNCQLSGACSAYHHRPHGDSDGNARSREAQLRSYLGHDAGSFWHIAGPNDSLLLGSALCNCVNWSQEAARRSFFLGRCAALCAQWSNRSLDC